MQPTATASNPAPPPMSRWQRFARAALGAFGWQVHFNGLPGPRGVIIIYPHTSNWDFLVLLFTKWTINVRARFLAKHTLFWWPLSVFLTWWGGIPVHRGTRSGIIQDLAARIRAADEMWIAITPEGTRSYRPGWRSGFYHMAVAAGVPVGFAKLDYARREVVLTEFVHFSGDAEADMERIAAYFADVRAKRPQLAAPVRWDDR